MTIQNNIESLYHLIINSTNKHKTFIDNLNLWQKFYNDKKTIIKDNILNPKLFTIINFLLEHEQGEISESFQQEILTEIEKQQESLAVELGNSETESLINIDKLITNLNNHNYLCKILKTLPQINHHHSKTLSLTTTNSLIKLVNNLFFLIETEIIKSTINFITKTISRQLDKTESTNNELTDTINYYMINIIPLKIFIGENLSNDTLIQKIKSQEIKDKKILQLIFEDLPLGIILKLFENNFSLILHFLNESSILTNAEKQQITSSLINRIIYEEEFYIPVLLKATMQDKTLTLLDEQVSTHLYNQIIISSMKTAIFYLDSNMIKYLLTSDYIEEEINDSKAQQDFINAKEKLISECRYLLKNEKYLKTKPNFDIKGLKQLLTTIDSSNEEARDTIIKKTDTSDEKLKKTIKNLQLGLTIDFDIAIDLLNDYFEDKLNLNTHAMQAIFRSIITKILNDLEINHNGVYFHTSNQTDGYFEEQEFTISINTQTIETFLNKKKPLYNRLNVLTTIFHEITHFQYENDRKNNNWSFKSYEIQKQWIINKYDFDFYMDNWDLLKEEMEAEVNSIDCLMKFIEAYFPYLLDPIQDELIEDLEQKKKLASRPYNEVMIFFASVEEEFRLAFDTLIRYNPNILIKNPIYNLEYHQDGRPKSYTDLLLTKTEQNKELIESILKNRYPNPNEPTLKKIHIK